MLINCGSPAWRAFTAANNGEWPLCGVGVDYLAACDDAFGERYDGAVEVADGLRKVRGGELDGFEHEQAAADTLAGRVPMMFALSRPLVLRPIAVRADGKFYQGRPGRAPVQCAPTRLVRPGMHEGRDPVGVPAWRACDG